jgi:hypothetical protein
LGIYITVKKNKGFHIHHINENSWDNR